MSFWGRFVANSSPGAASIARGDAARDRRNWAAAISAYEEALDKEPGRQGIRIQYAHALKENGQIDKAVKAYQKALEQQTDDWETTVHLAHALKHSGDRNSARLTFEKAVSLNPSDRESVDELRAIRRSLSTKGDPGEETHGEKQARSELAFVKKQRGQLELENRAFKHRESEHLGRLKKLEVELHQRQVEIDAQQAHSEQQKAKYEAEAAALKEQLNAAARFEAEAAALKEQLNAAARFEAEAATLKEQLNAAARFEAEAATLKEQLNAAARFEAEAAALKEQLNAAARFEAEASSLRALLEDVMAARSGVEARVTELAEQLQGARQELAAIKNENTEMERALLRTESVATEAQGEIDQLKATLRGNHEALDAFKQELNAVQEERKIQGEALRKAEAQRGAAQSEVERLSQAAASYQRTGSDTEQALKEKVSALESERQAHAETKGGLVRARDEIRRAEGQITLIQDLLLRQTGL